MESFPAASSPPRNVKKNTSVLGLIALLAFWPWTIQTACSQNQQTGWADKTETKWEERKCWGYIFRLQKQSGENFLAFAPNCGPVSREDETQRRRWLLEETRRKATPPPPWHTHTLRSGINPNLTLMQVHSTIPVCSMLPQYSANEESRCKPVCVCVCTDSIKRLWLYCTMHTPSHSGDDWAPVMLCKFAVGEDLLSIIVGWRPAKGGEERGYRGKER